MNQIVPNASPEGHQLMNDMLKYEPGKRPSCSQALQYPWFQIGLNVPVMPKSDTRPPTFDNPGMNEKYIQQGGDSDSGQNFSGLTAGPQLSNSNSNTNSGTNSGGVGKSSGGQRYLQQARYQPPGQGQSQSGRSYMPPKGGPSGSQSGRSYMPPKQQ